MSLKVIGISLGDLGGIGVEVTLKALLDFKKRDDCAFVIFGSAPVLFRDELKTLVEQLPIRFIFDLAHVKAGEICFMSVTDYSDIVIGRPDPRNGRMSVQFIEAAVKAIQDGYVHGLVTAPICKESLHMAGITFSGHTTLLQHLSGSKDVSMAFYTPRLKTILSTIHIPLSTVSDVLDQDLVCKTILHAHEFCVSLGIRFPKVAVAGLNPHAGESGMFGSEEDDVIQPAIAEMVKRGVHASGPYPADTVFFRAFNNEFDIVVSMYHDQGLIPIKLIGFHDAVNVTVGLPFIRTSPDHGTAFDIAYKGACNASSMSAALDLAIGLANGA
jgi:4-hydroxythreonine-4-phosphate dehydrogenase